MKRKRTKHLKAILFCLTLLSVVLSACQSDLYEFEKTEPTCLGIANARNWFEANAHLLRPSEVLTRNAAGEEEVVTHNPVFNWNLAEVSRNPEWEVVELPWEYEDTEHFFALWEVWQHAKANNSVPENVTRLVIIQHRQTGETFGFQMRIAPTLEFLLNYGESLHTSTYLHRDSRLSGVVVFYTLDGLFMNGWRYRNGEIVAGFAVKNEVNIDDVHVPRTRLDWELRSDDDGSWKDLEMFEFVVSGNSSSSFNTNHLFGLGGNFNIGTPDISHLTPGAASVGIGISSSVAAQIFAFLNTQDRQRVENMLREVLQHCLGEAMFSELQWQIPLRPIEIRFHNATTAVFNTEQRTITLPNNHTDAAVLFHEMFHAVQQGVGTGYGQLNREIETFFAHYLYARQQPWFQPGNNWYDFFNRHTAGQSIAGLANFVGTTGNRLPHITDAQINNFIRYNNTATNVAGPAQQLRNWRPNSYGRMQFSTAIDGAQNFTNLQRLSINC